LYHNEAAIPWAHTRNTAHAVNDIIDHLLADGVVAAGVVVGGILLAAD
jgi:hypothetical protein